MVGMEWMLSVHIYVTVKSHEFVRRGHKCAPYQLVAIPVFSAGIIWHVPSTWEGSTALWIPKPKCQPTVTTGYSHPHTELVFL